MLKARLVSSELLSKNVLECSTTDRLVEHRQSNDSANLSQHGQEDHDEEKSENATDDNWW